MKINKGESWFRDEIALLDKFLTALHSYRTMLDKNETHDDDNVEQTMLRMYITKLANRWLNSGYKATTD